MGRWMFWKSRRLIVDPNSLVYSPYRSMPPYYTVEEYNGRRFAVTFEEGDGLMSKLITLEEAYDNGYELPDYFVKQIEFTKQLKELLDEDGV